MRVIGTFIGWTLLLLFTLMSYENTKDIFYLQAAYYFTMPYVVLGLEVRRPQPLRVKY